MNEKDNLATFTRITNRATDSLLKAWNEITGTARALIGSLDPDLPKQDLNRLHKQINNCLNPTGGDVTARSNTIALGKAYLNFSDVGKERFLLLLLEEFDIDPQQIKIALENAQKDFNYTNKQELVLAINPPRYTIFKQFLALSNGLKFIVDMRADVLKLSRKHSALSSIEKELYQILSAWFDVGLLDMRPITWNSPASLLEKLIAYEAVHEISSWTDLRNRLDPDRRCFAFFHHKMPQEPLIFLEVALTNEISRNINVLLDESAPILESNEINTAVFYSISNTQHGLTGISLGNFLIKQVVETLSHEFTNIKNFVTLSPIPGFVKWVKTIYDDLEDKDKQTIDKLTKNQASFDQIDDLTKKMLLQLCAHYLLKIGKRMKAIDPVANFHLRNGASIKQINWAADSSTKGWNQSFGMMVNYHYELNKIDRNHENYVSKCIIPSSRSVQSISKATKKNI